MAASSGCSICKHTRRQAAEALLTEGLSPRKAAKQLGLSYSSLERHRINCIPRAMEKRVATKPHSLADPQAELERLHSETLVILEMASKANDHKLAFEAIQQARLNVQLAARMQGKLDSQAAPGNTLTLQMLTQIINVSKAAKA